jgi:hypothetical protein
MEQAAYGAEIARWYVIKDKTRNKLHRFKFGQIIDIAASYTEAIQLFKSA